MPPVTWLCDHPNERYPRGHTIGDDIHKKMICHTCQHADCEAKSSEKLSQALQGSLGVLKRDALNARSQLKTLLENHYNPRPGAGLPKLSEVNKAHQVLRAREKEFNDGFKAARHAREIWREYEKRWGPQGEEGQFWPFWREEYPEDLRHAELMERWDAGERLDSPSQK